MHTYKIGQTSCKLSWFEHYAARLNSSGLGVPHISDTIFYTRYDISIIAWKTESEREGDDHST